ncbi:hypothetical protein QRT08_15010 [Halalkalicoccus sp. NIPERK01]|nr:hypothetical protein [Halalkalicoccus sp. NIPERK01]MDL5363273.1 hypothetical protein [Halalkalicoccus sp. NIPERK01]
MDSDPDNPDERDEDDESRGYDDSHRCDRRHDVLLEAPLDWYQNVREDDAKQDVLEIRQEDE